MAVKSYIDTEKLGSFPSGLTDQARSFEVLAADKDFTTATSGGKYPKWILCLADATLNCTGVDDSVAVAVPMSKGQYFYGLVKAVTGPASNFLAGY